MMSFVSVVVDYFCEIAKPSEPATFTDSAISLFGSLGLLALLLHPIVPPRLSRIARLLITPFAICYSARFYIKGAIEFDHRNYGPPFQLFMAFFARSNTLKAIEWGLARDTTRFTWVGFGSDARTLELPTANFVSVKEKSSQGKSAPSNASKTRNQLKKEQLLKIRESMAKNDTLWEIVTSTIHLMTSYRGIGYAYGPPPRSQEPAKLSKFDPRNRATSYLRSIVKPVLWAVGLVYVGVSSILPPPPVIGSLFIAGYSLFPDWLVLYSKVGFMSWLLIIGGSIIVLHVFACIDLLVRELSLLLPKGFQLPPFDPRQYPPLFQLKWPHSISQAWSECWHQIMTPCLKAVALDPCIFYLSPLLGFEVARAIGVLAVFTVTGFLHEDHVPTHVTNPWVHYGGYAYFLVQALTVLGEQAYAKMTGRKIAGILGVVWVVVYSPITGYLRHRTVSACINAHTW